MSRSNRPRLLHLDANNEPRRVTAALLGMEHFDVEAVADLRAAEGSSGQGSFDVVVVEPFDRHAGGLVICRQLRERFPDTPIVVYTCGAVSFSSEEAVAAGVAAYVIKPHFEDLLKELKSVIGRAGALPMPGEVSVTTSRSSQTYPCKHCGNAEVLRSRRHGFLDWVVNLIGLKPYRCSGCLRRCYRRKLV